jgi:hypothetical protein
MSETLTETEVELYDSFITKKSPSDINDLNIASSEIRAAYKLLKNATEPRIVILNSVAMGFASYLLYKSRNNKFYVMYTYMNIPQFYYNFENEK